MTDIILNNEDLEALQEWMEGLSCAVREKTVLELGNGARLFYVNKADRTLQANVANNDKTILENSPNRSGEDDYRPMQREEKRRQEYSSYITYTDGGD